MIIIIIYEANVNDDLEKIIDFDNIINDCSADFNSNIFLWNKLQKLYIEENIN